MGYFVHRLVTAVLALVLATPALVQASTTVVVENRGSEPRQELRYDLDAVAPQSVNMDMSMSFGLDMAGVSNTQTMPTMRSVVSVDTPQVNDGTLRFGFSVGAISVLETPGVDPAMVDALRMAFAELGTVTGSMAVDARGSLLDSSLSLENVSPAFRQQLEQTVQTVHQSVVPFPEESVGPGARWSASEAITASGMTIHQTATYELLSVDGSTARIRTTVSQSAEAQVLALPELPPGTSAELVSYSGSGTGEITVRFDRAMPVGGMALDTSMQMRTTEPATGTVDMTMTIGLEAAISNVE